jgi:uncharacterized repeat protein (TIGR02543 family)
MPYPTKDGYSFGGWYTQQNGGGDEFTGSTTVNDDITVYTKWNYTGETEPPAPTQYTVTFDTNGGNGTAPSAQTVNAGSSIIIPGSDGLSYSGRTFDGWNTNSSGTGTTYSVDASYTPTTNITLYAKWNTVNAPEVPSITTITLTSNETGFRITWDSVSGATSYKISRSNSQYGNYSSIATGITDTSYDDTSVSMDVGNSYFYQIVSTSAGVDGSQSAPKGLTITAPRVRGVLSRTSNDKLRQGLFGIDDDKSYFTSIATSNGTSTLYTSWQTITPGTHTVYTATTTSTSTTWNPTGANRGDYVFKVFHAYRIAISNGNITDDGVELVVE